MKQRRRWPKVGPPKDYEAEHEITFEVTIRSYGQRERLFKVLRERVMLGLAMHFNPEQITIKERRK